MEDSSVIDVRNFINQDAKNPAPMKEVAEFWKACTIEERVQFTTESRALLKK